MDDVPVLQKEDFEIIWITFSWDGISYAGHAWVKGQYCSFSGGPDFEEGHTIGQGWNFYLLEGENLLYALATRKLFEDLVYYGKTACSPKPDRKDRGSDYFRDPRWQGIRDKYKELEDNYHKSAPIIGKFTEVFSEDDY